MSDFSGYYQDELAYLRELGREFAEAHPALAPMLAGLGVAVTFAGTPSAAIATAPVKPPARPMVAVTAMFPPWATLSALSERVSVMLPWLPLPLPFPFGLVESPPQAATATAAHSAATLPTIVLGITVPSLLENSIALVPLRNFRRATVMGGAARGAGGRAACHRAWWE